MISFLKQNFYEKSFLELNYTKVLNYFILLYIFSAPFPRGFNRPVAVVLLVLWILDGQFKSKIKLMIHNRVFIAFTLFVLFNYIALFWSTSQPISKNINYVNAYFAYFAFVVIWTSIQKEFIPKMITIFLFSMFINEVISYGIYFDLWETARSRLEAGDMPRAFIGHIEYSIFLAATVLFLLNKIIYSKGKYRYLYMLFFVFSLGNLLISGGRTGLVVLSFTLFVYILFMFKNRVKAFLIVVIGLGMIFVVSYNSVNVFQKRIDVAINDINLIQKGDFDNSLGIRTALIISSFEIIKQNPFLGAGIYDNLYDRVKLAENSKNKALQFIVHQTAPETNYHNSYLEILTQLGVIGLILFLNIFYALSRVKMGNEEFRFYKIIAISVLVSSMISSLTIHHSVPIAFYTILIAIVLSQAKIEQQDL